MEEIIKQLLDEKLSSIQGARLEGRLCLSDQAVNTGFMGHSRKESASGTSSKEPEPDYSRLMEYVTIDELAFQSESGRSVVSVKARVE